MKPCKYNLEILEHNPKTLNFGKQADRKYLVSLSASELNELGPERLGLGGHLGFWV